MHFSEYHEEKRGPMGGCRGFKHGRRHGGARWAGHGQGGHHHHHRHGGRGACRGAVRFHVHGAPAEQFRAPDIDMEAAAGANTCPLCKNYCSLDAPECSKGVEFAHSPQ